MVEFFLAVVAVVSACLAGMTILDVKSIQVTHIPVCVSLDWVGVHWLTLLASFTSTFQERMANQKNNLGDLNIMFKVLGYITNHVAIVYHLVKRNIDDYHMEPKS